MEVCIKGHHKNPEDFSDQKSFSPHTIQLYTPFTFISQFNQTTNMYNIIVLALASLAVAVPQRYGEPHHHGMLITLVIKFFD